MSKTDYIKDIQGAERRFFASDATVRMDEETGTNEVSGYAFKFNTRANIANIFEETISVEARVEERLKDDVRALFNHDPNLILARSKGGAGTLALSFDDTGLKYSYTTPQRSFALDLLDAIRSGDIDQSSFAFQVEGESWEDRDGNIPLRTITSFKRFFDVAPVTYPAYPDATVGARSLEAAQREVIPPVAAAPEEREERFDVYDAQLMLNKTRFKK